MTDLNHYYDISFETQVNNGSKKQFRTQRNLRENDIPNTLEELVNAFRFQVATQIAEAQAIRDHS